MHPLAYLTTLLLLLASPTASSSNALSGNPSPYLAMHGEDPVQWREWRAEALAEAQATNRPLFVSSGYFACHWCHVMQRESYRDPDIAALLNRHFIAVKIDRELHPALDDHLIGFVEQTAGQAGWPLNVFLTPEGYPLTGFTYTPPGDFKARLERVAAAWNREAETLGDLARRAAAERMKEASGRSSMGASARPADLAERLESQALRLGDELTGGFGNESRFPMAPNLDALLRLQEGSPDPALARFLTTTLDAIMNLGLRDHLGGGFFRYTVDPSWQTPHFEKMLYTQALLAQLFLRAATILQRPDYRAVARDTLDFMLRGMQGTDGGFIASLSAVDDRGIEGGYYLWDTQQLERLLTPEQQQLLTLVWRLEGPTHHEAGLLPILGLGLEEAAARLDTTPEAARRAMEQARASLITARHSRNLPRDDKQLAGWNGLALSALCAGVRAFGDSTYLHSAKALRDFLAERLWDGHALHRAVSAQGWMGEATLEDYAFVARGLRDWGLLADSPDDLSLSRRLVQLGWEQFYRDGGWHLAATPLLPGVPAEPALADSPLPSPAATLIGLTLEIDDNALAGRAQQALMRSAPIVASNPFVFASQTLLLLSPQDRRPN